MPDPIDREALRRAYQHDVPVNEYQRGYNDGLDIGILDALDAAEARNKALVEALREANAEAETQRQRAERLAERLYPNHDRDGWARDAADGMCRYCDGTGFRPDSRPRLAKAEPEGESHDPDYMCPNCVTPWKCNGPHIPEGEPRG